MDLNRIPIFLKVAEAGSFTGAARYLGLPKTTVSRKVAELEAELGVRLIHRTTRSLSLTSAGKQYARDCSAGLAAIESANSRIAAARQEPRGTIRVSAPADFSSSFLADVVAEFLFRHGDVRLELILTDERLNLVERGIDLAIRAGSLEDSTLIARKLGASRYVLCASPTYLETAGRPKAPADLKTHACIVFGQSLEGATWRLEGPDGGEPIPVSGRIAVNTMHFAMRAAIAGLGIARVPAPMAARDIREGRLSTVLERHCTAQTVLHAVFPSGRDVAPAVSAFIAFVVSHLRDGLDRRAAG